MIMTQSDGLCGAWGGWNGEVLWEKYDIWGEDSNEIGLANEKRPKASYGHLFGPAKDYQVLAHKKRNLMVR